MIGSGPGEDLVGSTIIAALARGLGVHSWLVNKHDAWRFWKIEGMPVPAAIIEAPRISSTRKRSLIQKLMALVAPAYEWPLENMVVIPRENPDESVARGGRLLINGGRPRCLPQAHRSCSDGNK
jgi:phenylpyruvate tautomerase PptA (4-oxalocrotonate tautomerase family)